MHQRKIEHSRNYKNDKRYDLPDDESREFVEPDLLFWFDDRSQWLG